MGPFTQVVLGQIISLFGNAALRFVLPLTLLRQTGSAAVYGMATALALLPALAGTLAGGVLADRWRKAIGSVGSRACLCRGCRGRTPAGGGVDPGSSLCALRTAGAVSTGGAGQPAPAAG